MTKKIYSLLGLVAFALMIYLIWSHPNMNHTAFVWMITLMYVVVMGSVHGALAHSLTPHQKRSQVVYPVFMGALYTLMAYLYIYGVLPQVIPGFF